MIKLTKLFSLSLAITTSATSAGIVPILCLSSQNANNPIFTQKVIKEWMLDIDADGILHGFNQNAEDPEHPGEFFPVNDSYLRTNGYTTLSIPASVVAIAPYAFAYRFDGELNAITEIDFTNATNLESIGDNAFNYCYALESNLDLSQATNLKYIGNSAFFYCTSLRKLTLPNSSTELVIGDHTFYACALLDGLVLYDNIKEIKNNAFDGCTRFETIDLTNLTSFPSWMLSSSWIFNSVGTKAKVEKCLIKIPYLNVSLDSWNEILHATQMLPQSWDITFGRITTKDDFNYDSTGGITSLIGDPDDFDALVIPDGVTKICAQAFKNVFTNKHIPLVLNNDIEQIESEAFSGCVALDSQLELPVRLNTLGSQAFYNCPNLKGNITIPAGIKVINSSVFENCGITGVKFHANVNTINRRSFYGCKNLSWIDVSCFTYGSPEWQPQQSADQQPFYKLNDNGAFLLHTYLSNPSAMMEQWYNMMISLGMTSNQLVKSGDDPAKWTFNFNTDQSQSVLPEKAYNSINNWDLRGFKKDYDLPAVLKDYGQFKTPNRTVSIGSNAFNAKLTLSNGIKGRLILNEGLKTINESAFSGNDGLFGDLLIPNTVSEIQSNAFYNCSNLNGTLILPESLTKLGGNVFTNSNFGMISIPSTLNGQLEFDDTTPAFTLNTSNKVLDLTRVSALSTQNLKPWILFGSTTGTILVKQNMKTTIQNYFEALTQAFPAVSWNSTRWPITEVEYA